MLKITVRGYGFTYDLIKLTDEEADMAANGELEDLDGYEFENKEDPAFTCFGACSEGSFVDIEDDEGNTIIDGESMDEFEQDEDTSMNINTEKDATMLAIINGEKGTFLGFELDIDAKDFDKDKLTFTAYGLDELIRDETAIVGAVYDGEELDEVGDMSTTGKSREYFVFTTDEYGCLDEIICQE